MDRYRGTRSVGGDGDQAVTIEVGMASAVGGRTDNQDRCVAGTGWAIVSDGAGGPGGGARAAELTVAAFAGAIRGLDAPPDEPALAAMVDAANAAVHAGRAEGPPVSAMAATLTAVVATAIAPGGSWWLVANVGDSPAWMVSGTRLTRLTREHNMAAELVRAGALSPDDARTHPGRHHITRAIGAERSVTAEVTAAALAPGNALALASDGIEVLDPAELHGILVAAPTAQSAADTAVAAALALDAPDNVTVVVLRHLPSIDDADRSP